MPPFLRSQHPNVDLSLNKTIFPTIAFKLYRIGCDESLRHLSTNILGRLLGLYFDLSSIEQIWVAFKMPSRHGGTLNSRRAASPLVRLVEGEESWEAPDHLQGVLPLNWGETEIICHMYGAQSYG
ncbi:uncharacterized protein TNCV_4009841 [Trichonephila clavipes]|nr:uncharacterized protein TNCV_4009841 [Trichonephila clavipes]